MRDASCARDIDGAEVVGGASYGDAAAMRGALEGAETVFLVSAGEARDRVDLHRTAVDAAVAAGVERIVYLSFLAAAPDCTFTFGRDHFHTEQHIREAGVRWTFLRDSLYLDYVPFFAGADGVIRGPAGDGRVGAVAREDVADVAAAVLSGHGHDGEAYPLTGPRRSRSPRRPRSSRARPARRSATWRRRSRRPASRAPRAARRTGRSRAGSPPTRRSPSASSTWSATASPGWPATRRGRSPTSCASTPRATATSPRHSPRRMTAAVGEDAAVPGGALHQVGLVAHPSRDVAGVLEAISSWSSKHGVAVGQIPVPGSRAGLADPVEPGGL